MPITSTGGPWQCRNGRDGAGAIPTVIPITGTRATKTLKPTQGWGELLHIQMSSSNAAARTEDALTHGLPPSDRVCWVPRCRWRRWRRWRCLPGCYATPAGELPRLTYTLFILTLASGAFVILSEELDPQRRAQAAASTAPFPEPAFRDAPLPQDTRAAEPHTVLIPLAENGHSSGHTRDAPGLTISPCPMACSPWCGLLISCGGTITVGPSQVGTGTGTRDHHLPAPC